jgi:hypothetical protein
MVPIFGGLELNAILILLAISAVMGLGVGLYFSWMAIVLSGLVLATIAAAVLHQMAFGALAGIAIIVVCLTINQVVYLIGAKLAIRKALPHHEFHSEPGESSHNDIAREHKWQEPPQVTRRSKRRELQ